MNIQKTKKLAGITALYQEITDNVIKIPLLLEHYFSLYYIILCIYVIFGISQLLLSINLYERVKKKYSPLLLVSTIFGIFWSFALLISGLIYLTSLSTIQSLYSLNPDLALIIWTQSEIIFEALGGGSELLGGLWILLLSFYMLKERVFSKKLNYLGIGIGICGVFSILPNLEFFTILFALGQIFWFFFLSYVLFKKN